MNNKHDFQKEEEEVERSFVTCVGTRTETHPMTMSAKCKHNDCALFVPFLVFRLT